MQETSTLLSIGTALLIGAASPGPSFVMVAKTAVTSGRLNGLSTAMGMGAGGFLFATLALCGLNGLLLTVPVLYLCLKLAGGLYLAYLGLKIWRGATQPLLMATDIPQRTPGNCIKNAAIGFSTQLGNPKTAIVYASVFATFLPPTPSFGFNCTLVALVFLIETGWYSIVAVLLSSATPRRQYLRHKAWLDRLAGGVMMALGLKLAASASH